MYLDPKSILSYVLKDPGFVRNIDVYIGRVKKLLDIFVKRDKDSLLVDQANKAIHFFQIVKKCIGKSNILNLYDQDINAGRIDAAFDKYKNGVLKTFINAKPELNCSDQEREYYKFFHKSVLDYIRYMGIDLKEGLCDVSSKEESMDLTNTSCFKQ